MYVSYRFLGQNVGGLFSEEYQGAPWSWGKLWIFACISGFPSSSSPPQHGGADPVMRANLSDEMNKPYVVTARRKD